MYIGNDLQVAESGNKIIDDISSSFNGSTTSFALTVGGYAPVPFPINTQQIYISVNGVIQEPDPSGSAGFKLLGTNIVFSSAPANGHAFFGVILSGADYVTVGTEFPAGSATSPSITFGTDSDTGMYSVTSGQMGFTSNGVQTFTLDGDGFRFNDDKKLIIGTGSDLNIYHSSGNSIIDNDTGELRIQGDLVRLMNSAGTKVALEANVDNNVELYFNNSQKFATTNTGTDTTGVHVDDGATHDGDVTFTGASANVIWDKSADDLIFTDNSKAVFGTSSDGLEIFHNGSNSVINEQGTGTLLLQVGGTTKVTMDGSGRLLVGHTSSEAMYYTGLIQVQGTSSSTSAITIKTNQNDSGGPAFVLGKSRGSLGGTTVVQNGDVLGSIFFAGADGTDTNSYGAEIRCQVDGAPGGNDMPGRLAFFTTADGAASSTERMRIHSGGQITIGTTQYNSSDKFTVMDPGSTFMSIRSDSHADGNSQILDFAVGTSDRASGNLTASIQADIHSTSGGTLKSDLLFFTNSGDSITQKVTIKDTGRVGIGIGAPAKLLDIANATSGDGMRIKSSGDTYNDFIFDANRSSANTHTGRILGYWNGTAIAYMSFDTGADTTNKDDGIIRFWTSASGGNNFERLCIASDGKIGIGITSPSNLLDVRANSTSTKIHVGSVNGTLDAVPTSSEYGISLVGGNAEFQLHKDGSDNYQLVLGTYQGSVDIPLVFRTGSRQERMRITNTGKVGIGDTSPDCSLHVNSGSADDAIKIESTDNAVNFIMTDAAGSSSIQQNNDTLNINCDPASAVSASMIMFNIDGVEVGRFLNNQFRLGANSAGIQFHGDTAAANSLDDYEEGTWTPTAKLTYNPDSRSTSTNSSSGNYVRIGRWVSFKGYMQYNITGTGSYNLGVDDLPFAGDTSITGCGTARDHANGHMFICESVGNNNNEINVLRRYDNNSAPAGSSIGISFAGWYLVAT